MRRYLYLLAIVALFAGLIWYRSAQRQREELAATGGEELLKIAAVRPQEQYFDEVVTFVATLEAQESAAVMAKAPGRTVLRVLVDVGDEVKAGQLLALLDDSLSRAALAQARAALARAGAGVLQTESLYGTAKKEYQRMGSLVKEKAASQQQFDQAEGAWLNAQAALSAARKQGAEAAAAVRAVEILLADHEIRAPVSGVVASRFIDPGDAGSGENPAFIVVSQGGLKAKGVVAEASWPGLRLGQRAEVTVDSFPGASFDARISRLSPVLDPATRTGLVEVKLAPNEALRPGMFARIRVTTGGHQALALPREAVFRLAGTGESACYVVSGDRATLRLFERGVALGNAVEIRKGLSSADLVVVTRSQRLRDGTRVEAAAP